MSRLPGAESIECERCGRCLSVCPVYQSVRVETLSPRGRLDLVQAVSRGELIPGKRYREALATCLQCLACFEACPKGLDVSRRILEARAEVSFQGIGKTLERCLLGFIPAHRPILAGLTRILAGCQRLLAGQQGNPSRHLPMFLPDMLAGRRIPRFDSGGIFHRLPEIVPPDSNTSFQGRIIFFTGCYLGNVEISPALATVRVLSANGFEVVIPRGQTCCGAPAYISGHDDIARNTARKNLLAMDGSDRVVTACATCGNTLRNKYPALFAPNEHEYGKVIDLADRTRDISEILAELPNLKEGRMIQKKTITIHDPCHLTRGQKVKEQVRQVLTAVHGLQIIEMESSNSCCGGGGLSGLKNPILSGMIGDQKIDSIEQAGADMVAAGCPGCLLQIRDRLSRRDSTIEAVHPVELLACSYGQKR